MALLFIYGVWHAVPNRRAVRLLEQGGNSLRRGEYGAARNNYNAVLRLVPNSAVARQGLACAFYLSGMRSTAALELTKGLEAGVFAERLGHCGHGLNLEDVFFAAKLGVSDAFAAPKVAGARRFEEALMEEPSGAKAEEPDRMLLGACLAERARLAGLAWDYAGNALDTNEVDDADRARFLACFGPPQQRRAGCALNPGVRACVLTPIARRAYFRDSRLANAPSRAGA